MSKLIFICLLLGIAYLVQCQNDPYIAISKLLISQALTNTNTSKLEYMCDTFGPRLAGSQSLEHAIDFVLDTMNQEGFENVRGESVPNITKWVRGRESLTLLSPRVSDLGMLALGGSVGTPAEGITAPVLVVTSFDDLTKHAKHAKGKIVVYNVPFTTYSETVQYRVFGADKASAVGAVAALVRSVTAYSLYTVHTGVMFYSGNYTKIPTAAITVEDAEMMYRMQNRGQKPVVSLRMEARSMPDPVTSRNIVGELAGAQNPEQIIVISGHIDSWDVGQGAMDDGAGFFSAWDALRIIIDLVESNTIPRPKRTIRVVGWVNEESGGTGARQYAVTHQNELINHVLAVESDSGNFDPTGFGFTGSDAARTIIQNILSTYLSAINTTTVGAAGCDADNGVLCQSGVPGGSLVSRGFDDGNGNDYYFNYHHSRADMITSLNYDGLRRSVASTAVLAYVVADMAQTLPRN